MAEDSVPRRSRYGILVLEMRQTINQGAEAKRGAALLDHIYMDAMGFGMGCSCLQITFQACNITEARRLYDALVPVAPLMVSRPRRSGQPVSQRTVVGVDGCKSIMARLHSRR